MKSARSIYSATTALGLVAFLLSSSINFGLTSSITHTAFGLLAVFGVLEIMLVSYVPRPTLARSMVVAPRPVRVTAPVVVRLPALVEYPVRRANAA